MGKASAIGTSDCTIVDAIYWMLIIQKNVSTDPLLAWNCDVVKNIHYIPFLQRIWHHVNTVIKANLWFCKKEWRKYTFSDIDTSDIDLFIYEYVYVNKIILSLYKTQYCTKQNFYWISFCQGQLSMSPFQCLIGFH